MMSQVNVKEAMTKPFKIWLYIAMAATGLTAVIGFILGGMSNWIAGLCVFLPAALICWALWMISGGKKAGVIIMLLTAVAYVAINFAGNPFAFSENALMLNTLASLPYAVIVIPTLRYIIKEKHLFKTVKE